MYLFPLLVITIILEIYFTLIIKRLIILLFTTLLLRTGLKI